MAKYSVCLSFAGEQRQYVKEVADRLKALGISYFYDEDELADLWGKELTEHLDDIYRKNSRFCVMFVSTEYVEKMWTIHERRSALARRLTPETEYVLPARFDDTDVPGLPPSVGFIDLRRTTPGQLAELIAIKCDRAEDWVVSNGAGIPTQGDKEQRDAEPVERDGPAVRNRRRALSRRGFVIGSLGLIGAGAAGGMAWVMWPKAGKLTSDDTTGIAFSRDGGMLISTHRATSNFERMVRIWDAGTRYPLAEVDGRNVLVRNPVVHPDGKSFVTNETIDLVRRDVRTGIIVKDKYGFEEKTDLRHFAADPEITCFAISPDGVLLAVGTSTDGPSLVDIAGRKVVAHLIPERYDIDRAVRSVTGMAFSPDGKRLAVAGGIAPRDKDWIGMAENGCTVWDITERRALLSLLAEPTNSVAFDPAGDAIATAGETGVRLWDPGTGAVMATFIGEQTHSLAFSPDGRTLLTGGATGVRFWDAGTGRLKRELSDNYVHLVAFSPDGKAVAAATRHSNTKLSPGCWLWPVE
ncbi:TIR domain-containing protein [Lentzea albidocapillata]|uniref:TIR domain-containing protein n=1 Tax=Lentzea albidocapillata TaxID=40571 RepID=A0A1W2EHS1_9PSEU|nr:TIR domain-containing protein [Lentzea albidocapillata]SMD09237.1 TIR domain-containing protein [Lentzea albidocapillata]